MVGPASVWQVKRDFQIAFLRGHGLQTQNYLADLGCGTLRGGIPIIEYLEPGHYNGFEVRADALAEAQNELEANGLEDKRPVLTRCDDLGSLRLEQRFDVIWAFSVLVHLDDENLDRALSFAGRHLAPDGVMFANVATDDREQGQWQGFPVISRPVETYAAAAAVHDLATDELGTLESLGHPPGLGAAHVMLRLGAARRSGRPS